MVPVPMKPAGNYWHLLTPFNIGMITSDGLGQLWPGGTEG
ncbi:Transposase [Shigella dysenteriae 1617]|uniref:Transposase n=1 Tax=Shigella dysenteriae 1617 TaxID=754093 RepID=A0A0A6ZS21_SHIDY|nr:Transposase [Shigella dysenteriae 1617]